MKRTICFILAAMLLLGTAGCAKQEPAVTEVTTEPTQTTAETAPPTTEATEPPTEATEPAPTEPDTTPAMAKAAYGELIWGTLDQGTAVNVLGTFASYYVIEGGEADLLIEQCFLRLEGEEPFEPWTGYAAWDTKVYADPYMEDEPIATLGSNQAVTVTEAGDGWLCVTWDGGTGYADPDQISATRRGSGGGGGGGGDGSDIPMGSLSYWGGIDRLGAYVGPEFQPMEPTSATVLIPNARVYLSLTLRGAELKLLEIGEERCTVWLEGLTATISRSLVLLEEDPLYEQKTVFARYGAELCEEYQLRTPLRSLSMNTELLVIDELPGCYVVELDGTVGYIDTAMVSDYRITGGGGSGNSGGWTPPAM